MTAGLDVGGGRIVVGGAGTTEQENAVLGVEHSDFVEDFLDGADTPSVRTDDQVYALGDAALEVAAIANEAPDPLFGADGSLPDDVATEAATSLLEALVGDDGGPLRYVPGNRAEDSLLEAAAEELGYDPAPIDPGVAVLYDALDAPYTGLGASIGTDHAVATLVVGGVPVARSAIGRGSDWIDEVVADATGREVEAVAEQRSSATLTDGSSDGFALRYDDLFSELVAGIADEATQVDDPLEVAIGGPGATPACVDERFADALADAEPGIDVERVVQVDEPERSIARGALVAAREGSGVATDRPAIAADASYETGLADVDAATAAFGSAVAEASLVSGEAGAAVDPGTGDVSSESVGDDGLASGDSGTPPSSGSGGEPAPDPDADDEPAGEPGAGDGVPADAPGRAVDTIEELEDRIEGLAHRIDRDGGGLEGRMDATEAEVARLDDDLEDLSDELTDARESLEDRLDDLADDVDGIEGSGVDPGRIEDLSTAVDELEAALDRTVSAERVDGLEASVETAESVSESVEDRIGGLEGQVEDLDDKADGLGDHIEEVDDRADDLAAATDDLDERIGSAEREIETVADDVEAVEADVGSVEFDVEEVRTDVDAVTADLESVEVEMEEFPDDPADSEAVADLRKRVDDAETAVAEAGELADDVEDVTGRLDVLTDRLEELEDAVAGGDHVDALEIDLDALRGRVEELEASVDGRLDDLREDLATAREDAVDAEELGDLEEEVTSVRTDADAAASTAEEAQASAEAVREDQEAALEGVREEVRGLETEVEATVATLDGYPSDPIGRGRHESAVAELESELEAMGGAIEELEGTIEELEAEDDSGVDPRAVGALAAGLVGLGGVGAASAYVAGDLPIAGAFVGVALLFAGAAWVLS